MNRANYISQDRWEIDWIWDFYFQRILDFPTIRRLPSLFDDGTLKLARFYILSARIVSPRFEIGLWHGRAPFGGLLDALDILIAY